MREIGLDQISLRNVKPQDMQFLDKWYSMGDELGYATGFKSFREVRERIMSYPMVSMIIALADDRAVGLICYETRNLGGKKVVWVHIIIVDPAWQSRGIGTRAVARLLDFFEARLSDVMASVSSEQARPQVLEALALHVPQPWKDWMPRNQRCIIMRKTWPKPGSYRGHRRKS